MSDVIYFDALTAPNDKWNMQYDYDRSEKGIWQDNFSYNHDGVVISLLDGDKTFKRGSDTMPRAELRLTLELGADEVEASVNYQLDPETPSRMQYSIMQAFDRDPVAMVRKRDGVWQFVVFNAKKDKKIKPIDSFPGSGKLTIRVKQGKEGGLVSLLIDDKVTIETKARVKSRDELHFKIGPYAQQMLPIGRTHVKYDSFILKVLRH